MMIFISGFCCVELRITSQPDRVLQKMYLSDDPAGNPALPASVSLLTKPDRC